MLTDEQFEYKIVKLKNKEFLHSELAQKYKEETDRLLVERAIVKIKNYVGLYVKHEKTYMKVEKQKIEKHGFYLNGKGFFDNGGGMWAITQIGFTQYRKPWEEIEVISYEEYCEKFNDIISKMKEKASVL